jgi:hypothetical protein
MCHSLSLSLTRARTHTNACPCAVRYFQVGIQVGLHADLLRAAASPGAGLALQATLAEECSDDDDDDGGPDNQDEAKEREDRGEEEEGAEVEGSGGDGRSRGDGGEGCVHRRVGVSLLSLPPLQAPLRPRGARRSSGRQRHAPRRVLKVQVCVLPHPSGVSHFWNDAAQRLRAARALRTLLGAPLPGEPGAEETPASQRFLHLTSTGV